LGLRDQYQENSPMKKLSVALGLAFMLSAGAAHAQYGMAGCGLGSLLFGQDNTKLMQILAATTNGTFGSQTFGITSGTSNCVEGGVVRAEREQAAFAEVNFQDLKRNMAAGGGEYLSSFATLLGCQDLAKPAFAKMTQTRYEALVPSTETTPMQMLSTVKAEIKATPSLANQCSDARAIARAQGKTLSVASR
jgi:hypothetical protein